MLGVIRYSTSISQSLNQWISQSVIQTFSTTVSVCFCQWCGYLSVCLSVCQSPLSQLASHSFINSYKYSTCRYGFRKPCINNGDECK